MGISPDVRKFILRSLILTAPLIATVVPYVVWDPFRVVRTHQFADYYDEAAPVELNRDYVSLEMFLQHEPREHYDSFIFGSSRSFPLHCDTWQKYVPGIKPFHYPAASENLYGIYLKIKYLHEHGYPLKHVLMEMAPAALRDLSIRIDTTHRLHYRLTGEGYIDFQGAYMSWYFKDEFFLKYIAYKATGSVAPSSRKMLGIRSGQVKIDPLTNDYFWAEAEREIAADEKAYYVRFDERTKPPAQETPPCEPVAIEAKQREYLRAIRAIFDARGTEFRILLPPVYDRICADPRDVAALEEIFGTENVFVFSGNNELTRDKRNFYDYNHVRPFVGDALLAKMYRHPPSGTK